MDTQKPSIGNVALAGGLFIFLGMVLYFLIMKFAGFAHIPELRFLNVLIAAAGGIGVIKYYNSNAYKRIKYLSGFMLSFITIMIGSIVFSIFIYCYFSFIDPQLLHVISIDAPMTGIHISPFTTLISIISEGAVSGLVISFILMQYFKDDELHAPYKTTHGGLQTEEN